MLSFRIGRGVGPDRIHSANPNPSERRKASRRDRSCKSRFPQRSGGFAGEPGRSAHPQTPQRYPTVPLENASVFAFGRAKRTPSTVPERRGCRPPGHAGRHRWGSAALKSNSEPVYTPRALPSTTSQVRSGGFGNTLPSGFDKVKVQPVAPHSRSFLLGQILTLVQLCANQVLGHLAVTGLGEFVPEKIALGLLVAGQPILKKTRQFFRARLFT